MWFSERVYILFLRNTSDRKATLGITELSRPGECIYGGACFIDVGSLYPGRTQAAKGAGVHRLKGIVSWVQNEVTQFGLYLLEVFDA